jgi:hypothetical protein
VGVKFWKKIVMKKMVNKIITTVHADWGKIEVSEIEKQIKDVKKLGATHIMYDEETMELTLMKERLETDAEYKIRTDEEEMRSQRIINKEREEYLRLKEKFENDEYLKNSPIKQRNHFRRVKDELDRRRKK